MNERDQLEGLRYEASFHEAGHLVSGYVLGLQVEWAKLGPAEFTKPGELPDCVRFAPAEIADVHDAEDHIVTFLAGEATPRVAWAKGLLVEERRPKRLPAKELTVDQLVSLNGASGAASAAYFGVESMAEEHDGREARRLAEAWTSSPIEAAALMGWCRARTAELVATDRFQALAGVIAAVLLDKGEISGELAFHLLERADSVLQPTEGGKS